MIDEDTVIGRIPATPARREYCILLSDLDPYWQGRLMVIDSVDNARIAELEARLAKAEAALEATSDNIFRWLGFHRDGIKPSAVSNLQDVADQAREAMK